MTEKKHKNRMIFYGALTGFIMCCIFLMSAQNGEESGRLSNSFLGSLLGALLEKLLPELSDQGAAHDIRKYAHMFEYLCLGLSSFLFVFEAYFRRRRRVLRTLAVSLLFCFLYACSDEWHQSFVPGRAGRFADVLIDSVGYCTGIFALTLIKLTGHLDKCRKKG